MSQVLVLVLACPVLVNIAETPNALASVLGISEIMRYINRRFTYLLTYLLTYITVTNYPVSKKTRHGKNHISPNVDRFSKLFHRQTQQ